MKKMYVKQFYKGNKCAFIVSVFTALLSGLLALMVSFLMQQLIDTISGVPGALPLKILVLITGGLMLGVVLLEMMDYLSRPRFMKKAMEQYKEYVFDRLIRKNIHSFHSETTATYISALSNDANSIEVNYLEKQFALITHLVTFFGAFAMMVVYSPLLTLIAVLLTILPVIATVFVGNRREKAELDVSDKNEKFVDTLKESIHGFSVIKSFRAESTIHRLFSKKNRDIESAKCKKRKVTITIELLSTIASVTAQLGVFIAGAYLAISGKGVTAGVVIVFVNLMNFVLGPISALPEIMASRKASLALIQKLADALEKNVRQEGKSIPGQLEKGITMQHVSFAYQEGENVLKDINLTFEAGKSYALVGASGSGKSTMLNLLLAAHENYEGKIQYDEHEINSITGESLYDMVSVIQQNVIIFNASLRDNVTMFGDASKEEVDRVIKMAGLEDFVKDHGKDYLCGENGSALSGGEKQRISIARSLLRKSSVLLVDEATAALDAKTAFQVSNAILNIDDLTRIVVTHSLEETLLKRYDCIVVLKSGQIVETGKFDELMEQKEYFYSLYTVSQ